MSSELPDKSARAVGAHTPIAFYQPKWMNRWSQLRISSSGSSRSWQEEIGMKNPPILISVIGFSGPGRLLLVVSRPSAPRLRLVQGPGGSPGLRAVGLWAGSRSAPGSPGSGLVQSLVAPAWASTFAVVVAGFALFEAFLWFLEYPGTGVGFSASIMPLIILLYLDGREVRTAFGKVDPRPSRRLTARGGGTTTWGSRGFGPEGSARSLDRASPTFSRRSSPSRFGADSVAARRTA